MEISHFYIKDIHTKRFLMHIEIYKQIKLEV